MKCLHCSGSHLQKGRLILNAGLELRVLYCSRCERVQRIGDSVPDLSDKAKIRYFIKPESTRKGGDKP